MKITFMFLGKEYTISSVDTKDIEQYKQEADLINKKIIERATNRDESYKDVYRDKKMFIIQ